jgi:hypothetical protein
MTVAAAVVGGVTVAAVAKGVMAVVATLATPPVAVTVGALAGGALGWSFVQSRVDKDEDASSSAAVVDTPHKSGTEEAAESLSES